MTFGKWLGSYRNSGGYKEMIAARKPVTDSKALPAGTSAEMPVDDAGATATAGRPADDAADADDSALYTAASIAPRGKQTAG